MALGAKKVSKERKEELWNLYRVGPDDEVIFNELVEAYIPLVELIASKVKSSLPPHVEIGDLINDGFFGLVDAIVKFDESRGYRFETYASTRIRGEINDRLRDYDSVSRHSRKSFKELQKTEMLLLEENQSMPTDSEICERLGWDLDELNKIRFNYNTSHTVNIDEYMNDSTHESFSLRELIADESAEGIDHSLHLEELSDIIINSLSFLEEHESVVIYLYAFENLKFTEIAEILDMKPNQIAKIFHSAIECLRQKIIYG